MGDGVSFVVGTETGDHLRLTVLKRFGLSPDEWLDFGSLLCRVDVQARGTRADFEGTFRAEGFENLRHDLAQLDQAFRPGVVRFEPGYEEALTFAIVVGELGGIEISGEAIDGLGTGVEEKLTFRFGVEDTLRAIAATAESVARAYPPSPITGLVLRSSRSVSP